MDFLHYQLKETPDGYEVYLYLDPNQEEFASEFGTLIKEKSQDLHKSVQEFVKKRFGHVKVITATVMIGTTLLTVIPLQDTVVSAHEADFAMSYIYFGSTSQNIRSVDQAQGNLDVVSPSYFNLNADGSLAVTPKFDSTFVDEMHKRGIRVVPFLSNHWDREEGRAALENREYLTDQLAAFIIKHNLDGINVDIENVTDEDRDHYTDLVRLLREKLPADKEISVAVAANPHHWKDGWHGSYDNKELAKYADYLMVMAYDEHYQGGDPGPVASYDWVDKTLKAIIVDDGVSPDQVVLGLPFFGRYWNDAETTGGYGASNTQVEAMVEKYNGTVIFDPATASAKATFTIKDSDPKMKVGGRTLKAGTYEAWFENNETLAAKMELVHKYNLKGTGSWSLGQENPTVWNHYAAWAADENAPTPVGGNVNDKPASVVDDNTPTPVVDEAVFTSAMPFLDARNHWAHDEILYAYQKDWFSGKSSTQFAPNDGLTRAQAAAVFVKVLNLKPIEPIRNSSFSDVGENHWAKDQIEIVRQHGVFKGAPNNQFNPNQILTRGQMAAVLDNIFHEIYDPAKKSVSVSFRDVQPGDGFYEAIKNMKQQGIIEGSQDGRFNPQNKVTRAQMSVILTNANEFINKVNGEKTFPNLLRNGSSGADVTLLQIYLKRIGMRDTRATGMFDMQTDTAVRQFQEKHGLGVDGIVGPNTAGKLIEVLSVQ